MHIHGNILHLLRLFKAVFIPLFTAKKCYGIVALYLTVQCNGNRIHISCKINRLNNDFVLGVSYYRNKSRSVGNRNFLLKLTINIQANLFSVRFISKADDILPVLLK